MKFKKLYPEAHTPTKAYPTDAGYDLKALQDVTVPSLFKLLINNLINSVCFKETKPIYATKILTGIALEIPQGMVGLIWDRSSMGTRLLKVFGGVIDEMYTADITVCMANFSFFDHTFKAGDKVAQLVLQKVEHEKLEEVAELSNSDRGDRGFGSSGQ